MLSDGRIIQETYSMSKIYFTRTKTADSEKSENEETNRQVLEIHILLSKDCLDIKEPG